ncbi:MAG TPA: NAD(P)H-dependent oxidoreductase subunit E [Acidimicrobiales bacterium]|nr:NAD(P)H-dependent oxidoreductase subunit E [Acidimicrobiales bacterium]
MGAGPDALIEALHAVQETFGYLDAEALAYVGASLRVPPSRVYGVATFYSFFTLKPAGEHAVVVCLGTACYINGSGAVLAGLQRELGVEEGGTTDDGRVSLLTAHCVGTCSLAPVCVVDGEMLPRVTAASVLDHLTVSAVAP